MLKIGVVMGIFGAYQIAIGAKKGKETENLSGCDSSTISTWLIVHGCVQIVNCFRAILQSTLLRKSNRDEYLGAMAVVNIVHFATIFNFQVAWLIYGNTLHYTATQWSCKKENSDFSKMWVSMQVTLILGYFIFLLYAFVWVTTLRYLCSLGQPIAWIHKKPVLMLPFLSALAYYHDRKFPQPEQKELCGICLVAY